MYCKNCGANLNDDWLFCNKCGLKIEKAEDGTKDYNLFNKVVDGNILAYQYMRSIACIDHIVPMLQNCGGKKLDFIQEPENKYDSAAVAIYLDNQKLGYVHRGQTQDMINDWICTNRYFYGYINTYSSDEITYKIGFYNPLCKYECKNYKISAINEDATTFCHPDSVLSFYYDDDKNKNIVCNPIGEDLGTLPAAFKYADENDLSIIGIIIDDIYEDDNYKTVIKVNVYFK